jgi:regulator of protease activity HflC (stomatin/prohibitin superfamily)
MMDLTSKRSIYDNISKHIEEVISNKIKSENIPIKLLKVIIDKARPNKDVLEEYTRTAMAIQALQTQKAQSSMELARKTTEENRAIADDAYRQKMGFNADQYIKLRALEIEKEKVDMLRNKNNISVSLLMSGESGGAYPTYQIK